MGNDDVVSLLALQTSSSWCPSAIAECLLPSVTPGSQILLSPILFPFSLFLCLLERLGEGMLGGPGGVIEPEETQKPSVCLGKVQTSFW